jgi:hypothetical protein
VADLVERFEKDRKVFLSTGLSVRHSAFGVRTSSGVFLGKLIRLTAGHQAKVEDRAKDSPIARALDDPSVQRKLSAVLCEPSPTLTDA